MNLTRAALVAGSCIFALGIGGNSAHAQSNYATSYYFVTLAGTPGVPGSTTTLFNTPFGIGTTSDGLFFVTDPRRILLRSATGAYVNSIEFAPGGIGNVFTGLWALGSRSCVVTDYEGHVISTVSSAATLTLLAPPAITIQPVSQSVAPGEPVTFTTAANGSGTISFQWRRDGVPLTGATATSLILSNVQASNLGSYTVVASNNLGPATSNAAVLSFSAVNAGRLANLSIRTEAASGAGTLIVGFVVGGANIAGTKPLLIRGIGPAARPRGLS